MLNEEKTQFQKEQNELLKTVLDLRFFLPWQDTTWDEGAIRNDTSLEIYITNVCNQRCEYCYLTKYPDLYPEEYNSPELIKKNLRILYEYILEKGYNIPKLEFFSGEIWHSQFGWDILDITLEYIKRGMTIGWIMIASNCSFVIKDSSFYKIQNYIDEFQRHGAPLVFSISCDGRVIEDTTRPLIGESKDDDYYERLFTFAKHNNFYFHPMVASISAKQWIENYKWWINEMEKWDMDPSKIMMLEVRNADWTDESIQAYCEFIDYLIEEYFQKNCKGDVELFTRNLFNFRGGHDEKLSGYIPWAFPQSDTFIGCTCATDLSIRLGDLAIVPCHRTAYNKYLYGKFKVENDKIVGIEANNPQMAVKILMSNFNLASFGCDTCVYNDYCLKGCFGAQYEELGDPFFPVPNVCKFFKNKYDFLLNKYTKMGVIDYLKTCTKYEQNYNNIAHFLEYYRRWEEQNGK